MTRMLKRLLASILALMMLSIPVLAEAATADTSIEAPAIETRVFPFLYSYNSGSDPVESEMNLSFINGGDIPYLAVSDFAGYLATLYQAIGFGDISFECSTREDSYVLTRPDNSAEMAFSPSENLITFLDYDAFVQHVGQKALVTAMEIPDNEPPISRTEMANAVTELSQNGIPAEEALALIQSEIAESLPESDGSEVSMYKTGNGYLNRYGNIATFRLGDYDIELCEADGQCYVPLQTMIDLLINPMYVYWVYNGEKVIGATYQNPFLDTVYEAPTGMMSEEFARFNYNELCFMLDHLYGLKPEHNISDFNLLISGYTELGEDLAGTDPVKMDAALIRLLDMYFDDGHSGFIQRSYLSGPLNPDAKQTVEYLNFGPSSLNMIAAGSRFRAAREAVYGEEYPAYEEVGNTAFITFDEFSGNRAESDYYNNPAKTLEDVQDTIDLIYYANEQIKREGSPIENVVVDLSNNGGGNSDAAVTVISWLLGEAQIALRNTLTGAETAMVFYTDVNCDGTIDNQDDLSQGFNVYVLTSINSFSCGNLVPAACKASNRVTLIGQCSGGGSCVVSPASNAAGSIFQISGPRQLAIMKNGAFYNIDNGIEPDVVLTKPESFYNREALAEKINNLD